MKGIFILLGIAAGWLLIREVLSWILGIRAEVIGQSMEPTLPDGSDHWMLPLLRPKRYDVVLVRQKREEGQRSGFGPGRFGERPLCKRIIALPGETVQIKNGAVYINGERLTDDPFGNIYIQRPGKAAKSITLGKDEYFCLGDNRNGSEDSRVHGPVGRKRIVRRVIVPRARETRFRHYYWTVLGVKSDEAERTAILERVKKAREIERAKEKAAKEARRHGD